MKKTSKLLKNLNEADHENEALVIELDESNKYTKKHKDESLLKEKILLLFFFFSFLKKVGLGVEIKTLKDELKKSRTQLKRFT